MLGCSGIQLFHNDSSSRKRDKGMSLSFGISYGDAIYIATDSRSSIIHKGYSFGGVKEMEIESDNYKKISRFEFLNYEIIMTSTGQNKFNGKTFSEALIDIDYSACPTIYSALHTIYKFFEDKKEDEMDISFISYIRDKEKKMLLVSSYSTANSKSGELSNIEIAPYFLCYWQGASWGIEVLRHTDFEENTDNEPLIIEQINSVYKRIEILSPRFDETIGGSIHIGKLTPDGFTWLQNGYEL